MAPKRQRQPHSAEFFGPQRDHWWNRDHLALIAARFGLESVRSALDVGCGVGHWGRLVATVLPDEATITGIDREPAWVRAASELATRSSLGDRFRYQEGIAEALEFADGGFDLVTCQTVLIHAVSPRAVIREMLRVCRPGGVILVAEPNNRASLLVDTSVNAGAPVEDLLERLRFALTCERGKAALGEGHNSIGDLLPGYLAEEGVENVQTFISDKTEALVPPYGSEGQQALRAYTIKQAEEETWGWSREDARRFFTAGGGGEDEFDLAWGRRQEENRAAARALERGTFHTAGGTILYAIGERKPTGAGPPARA